VIYLVVIYATYVPDWEFTVRNTDSQDYGKVFTVSIFLLLFHENWNSEFIFNELVMNVLLSW